MSLRTFTDIKARSECTVCSFLCLAILQSSFELDDTRTLAVEMGRNSYMRSGEYRAAGTILYENAEEFQHHTQLEKMIVLSWLSSTRMLPSPVLQSRRSIGIAFDNGIPRYRLRQTRVMTHCPRASVWSIYLKVAWSKPMVSKFLTMRPEVCLG